MALINEITSASDSRSTVCIQKFVCSPGPSPWYALTTWERTVNKPLNGQNVGTVKSKVQVKVCTSGFPYISNLAAHLDPAGIPRDHIKWWVPGSEDEVGVLENEVKMVVRGISRGYNPPPINR